MITTLRVKIDHSRQLLKTRADVSDDLSYFDNKMTIFSPVCHCLLPDCGLLEGKDSVFLLISVSLALRKDGGPHGRSSIKE